MAAGLDNGIVQAVSGENVMRKARAFIKYTILFTRQRKPTAFKFWRLPMTDGVCSTGLAGFNKIGCTATDFPPLPASKPAREPGINCQRNDR